MARLGFALDMIGARWNPARSLCPYCDSRFHRRLERKKLLIEARKCDFCGLVFRWPCDNPAATRDFYEGSYDGQQATTLPVSIDELGALTRQQFRNTPYDRSHRIALVQSIVPQGRLLDFGCSWGYSVAQWQSAGYSAVGFELARDRARFGRTQLGVDIRDDLASLENEPAGSFDIVYTDHVFEHLPALRRPLNLFARLLRPGGLLLMMTPNGGGADARRMGTSWGPFIGESHTIALTAEWCYRNLPSHGFTLTCYSSPEARNGGGLVDGDELICQAHRL